MGGDVPSDFPNPYSLLYFRAIPIRLMEGCTQRDFWFKKMNAINY